MRHKVAGRRFSRPTGHRISMYRNLVTDLLRYEKITTTLPKAREIRAMAEKMITLGKRGTLHHRRQALAFVLDKDVVDKLFSTLAARYATRLGGYTRTVKLGPRAGDGAETARIELVQ
ncbi:MAG: 50S ribosomal protein L17 [Chloroflexi bacterium]|nr:50S ribosomal protein L17 [Chloroflexota bacterium]